MNFELNVARLRADRVGPPPLPDKQPQSPKTEEKAKPSFSEHLKKACEDTGVRTLFSRHAVSRVDSRGINLSHEQLARIDRAIDNVEAKNVEKTLVMLDDIALIVGMDQRKVITLVSSEELKQNVFTNIDSAVIA